MQATSCVCGYLRSTQIPYARNKQESNMPLNSSRNPMPGAPYISPNATNACPDVVRILFSNAKCVMKVVACVHEGHLICFRLSAFSWCSRTCPKDLPSNQPAALCSLLFGCAATGLETRPICILAVAAPVAVAFAVAVAMVACPVVAPPLDAAVV